MSSSGGLKNARHQRSSQETQQLRHRLESQLQRQSYECMICYERIKRSQPIWHCQECCFAVFHLTCISKWAQSAQPDSSADGGTGGGTAWRCPACQYLRVALPGPYFCFCGKVPSPEFRRVGVPHSCGQLCGRPLRSDGRCLHVCRLTCHPGPCPPCEALVQVQCHGQHRQLTVRCADLVASPASLLSASTDSLQQQHRDKTVDKLSCGKTCGKSLACGRHRCTLPCHGGPCTPCTDTLQVRCRCGHETRSYPCVEHPSVKGKGAGLGFTCTHICDQPFDCGVHKCQWICHRHRVQTDSDSSLKQQTNHCPFSPDILLKCPCGKKTQKMLGGRTSCSDPIKCCEGICGRTWTRPCGHRMKCKRQCHEGPCILPDMQNTCGEKTRMRCPCGGTEQLLPCPGEKGAQLPPCETLCKRELSCGKHLCRNKCCTLKENEHACHVICEKPLDCGRHQCSEPCHKGRCARCQWISWSEYRCECGRTRLDPPITCNTKLPTCPFPCIIPSGCPHALLPNVISSLQHPCHPATEPCPPCPILVERVCACGKQMVKVRCSQTTPGRCPSSCDGLLACGHRCQRGCHEGSCDLQEKSGELVVCRSKCGKIYAECQHPCSAVCHSGSVCPPCSSTIILRCPCGRIEKENTCSAAQPIECEQLCLVTARNERLANALLGWVKETPDQLPPSAVSAIASTSEEAKKVELVPPKHPADDIHYSSRGWKKPELCLRNHGHIYTVVPQALTELLSMVSREQIEASVCIPDMKGVFAMRKQPAIEPSTSASSEGTDLVCETLQQVQIEDNMFAIIQERFQNFVSVFKEEIDFLLEFPNACACTCPNCCSFMTVSGIRIYHAASKQRLSVLAANRTTKQLETMKSYLESLSLVIAPDYESNPMMQMMLLKSSSPNTTLSMSMQVEISNWLLWMMVSNQSDISCSIFLVYYENQEETVPSIVYSADMILNFIKMHCTVRSTSQLEKEQRKQLKLKQKKDKQDRIRFQSQGFNALMDMNGEENDDSDS